MNRKGAEGRRGGSRTVCMGCDTALLGRGGGAGLNIRVSATISSAQLTSPLLTSPHLTSPHLTSPHLTSPHLTSPHLTSPHLTSPHLTTPHHTTPHHTTPHFTTPHHTTPHHTKSVPCKSALCRCKFHGCRAGCSLTTDQLLRGTLGVQKLHNTDYRDLPAETLQAVHTPHKKPGKSGVDLNTVGRPALMEAGPLRFKQKRQWRRVAQPERGWSISPTGRGHAKSVDQGSVSTVAQKDRRADAPPSTGKPTLEGNESKVPTTSTSTAKLKN